MGFDAHKNLAVASVATAPSPASSGTSLVVGAGQGARFPAVPFNCTIWPVDMAPDPTTAEVVRVTARTTDTLTITRAQEGTTARTVLAGDLIAATITALSLTDIESGTNFPLITTGAVSGTTGTFSGTLSAPTHASAAATPLILAPAGTERGRMHSTGGFSWGSITDPGAGNFSIQNDLIFTSPAAGTQLHRTDNTGYLYMGSGVTPSVNDGANILMVANTYTGANKGALELAAGNLPTGSIDFVTGVATKRGRIHYSGGFSWGSTADPGAGSISVGTLGAGSTNLHLQAGNINIGNAGTAAAYPLGFYNANGVVGSVSTTGAATAYNTTSDARLKRDRGPHTDLDVLRRTVVHDFTWRTDDTLGRGVFAQEAAEVAPFAVAIGTDDRDAGGNLTRPWGVDYAKYVPDLIVGWQDHDATVIELRGDVAVLTARLVALEDRRIVSARSSFMQRVRLFINGLFPAWVTP